MGRMRDGGHGRGTPFPVNVSDRLRADVHDQGIDEWNVVLEARFIAELKNDALLKVLFRIR